MVSFQQLRQANPATLRTAADGARKVARELEQFGTDSDRHRVGLTSAWTGTDADYAGHRIATHSRDYQTTSASYGRVDTIVTTLAGEIDRAKQLLESAVSMAPSIPGQVGADGSVHVNWSALGSNPSPAAITAAQQRAQQVAGYIRDAVMQANAADQRAQGELVAVTGSANVRVSSSASTAVPREGTDPRQVKQWWDNLSLEQQEQLIHTDPHGIGGLDGVPATARDQANRIGLAQERGPLLEQRAAAQQRLDQLDHPFGRGDHFERMQLQQARRELNAIDDQIANIDGIQAQLNRTDLQGSTERMYLLDYDSAHDGQVVMAVGNPDTADNIVTHVPGTGADIEGVNGDINRALWMQADAAAADPNRSTAAVMWLGYDAPDRVFPNAIFNHYYEDAAADLASFQHGLRATHEGPASINTLMGHSYGASTIGYAAHHYNLEIDNLVQVASPGGGFHIGNTADDYLAPEPEHVWATRGSDDPIRWASQVHGNDPIDADFGGRVFPADPGGHGGYWDPTNQARGHMSNIITGQYDLVPHGRPDPMVSTPRGAYP